MKGLRSKSAKRYIALLLSFVMMAMTALTSVAAEATGRWLHRDDGKWEYYINEEQLVSAWLHEGDEWYWFDEDGFMVEDCWIKDMDGVDKFYARPGGPIVQRHWYEIKGDWYYFGEDGYLLRKAWIQWSADGEVTEDSDWYYVGKDGKMVTNAWIQWEKDKNMYHLNKDGIMDKNAWIIEGTVAKYVGSDGIMAADAIVTKDGKQVYVDKDGIYDAKFSGSVTVNGITYEVTNGEIGKITGVATASDAVKYDAAAVEQLENVLKNADEESLTPAQKANIADTMVTAIIKDSTKTDRTPGSTAIVTDAESAKEKENILREAYGKKLNLLNTDKDGSMEVNGTGLIVASNYQSSKSGKETDTIELKLEVTSPATASNADRVDFDLSLSINEVKHSEELATDVYLTITVPDGFEIDKERYEYTLKHEGKTVDGADFSEDGTVKFSVTHFSPFSIERTLKEVQPATPPAPNRHPNGFGSSSSSRITPTGKWLQAADGVRWWYQNPDGTWPANGWAQLVWNGKTDWYYFDAEGYMVTGWVTWENNRYYLHPVSDGTQGYMYTGWHEIDGKWYYFRPESGGPQGSLFVNGTTPDGYNVDANGVWIQ